MSRAAELVYCIRCLEDVEPNTDGRCPRCGSQVAAVGGTEPRRMGRPPKDLTETEPAPTVATPSAGLHRTAAPDPLAELRRVVESLAAQIERDEARGRALLAKAAAARASLVHLQRGLTVAEGGELPARTYVRCPSCGRIGNKTNPGLLCARCVTKQAAATP